MAFEDDRSATAYEMRGTLACLAACPALAGVGPDTLAKIARDAVHYCLPAGDTLFDTGSQPEGIYLVTSGRLGARDRSRPQLVTSAP